MTKKNKRRLLVILSIIIVGAITSIIYYNKKIKNKHGIINKISDLKIPTSYEN